jgi:hypothetical protein
MLLLAWVDLENMSLEGTFRLVAVRAPVTGLRVYKGARIRLHFLVLRLDVCLQSLLLTKCLVTRWVLSTVELGLVDIPVSLQPTLGRETLFASRPVASESSFDDGVAVGVLHVTLKMVFTGERLVAARLRAGKGSFLVVAAHVGFEAAWSIEALFAAFKCADVVPLAACLTIRPQFSILGVVDLEIVRIVGLPSQLFLGRICCNGPSILSTTSYTRLTYLHETSFSTRLSRPLWPSASVPSCLYRVD